MSILEKAVSELADALDALETRIGDRAAQDADGAGDMTAVRRHVRAARARTDDAASDLSDVINELHAISGAKDKS